MSGAEIVKQFIEKNTVDGVCKYSQKKCAEIIMHKHPGMYHNVEGYRKAVRYVIGKNGDEQRKFKKIEWKGFQLPKPEKNDYSKFILKEKKIGILSDIHFPFYDEKALDIAVNHLLKYGPEVVILNGDCIDMYQASDFERDPRERSPKYEFDLLREFVDQMVKLFPRVVYKLGNHCERYEKKIMQRLPDFLSLEWNTFEFALHFERDYKIDVVKNKRIIMAGGLNILHGHETAKGFIAPVNVARGFYLKTKANVIAGHHHRVSEHLETDINGRTIGAWSMGCLCELHPKYMPINNWQHGFALVDVDGEEFEVHNKKILNGKVR